MTRRLLLAPVVAAPVALAAVAVGFWSGYLWPVATTVWSVIAPRPVEEPDIVA